jgi:perosamine synthetase
MSSTPPYNIPLAKPTIQEADIENVARVLRSGALVQGPEVAAVEHWLCSRTGVPFAAAAANGTATLHLALLALGIGTGDEVIVPAFSYVATANAVELTGARPVFVDVRTDTFNIDAAQIERAITPRTRAIMPVHEFGLCAGMTSILEIAARRGLPVIEDAACALGARDGECEAGSMGDFGSFSFHPRKAATAGEGGALLIKKEAHWHKVRALRSHGVGLVGATDAADDFLYAGLNYRLTDIAAALLRGQLERLDKARDKRTALAARYSTAFTGHPLIVPPTVPEGKVHAWQTYHVMLHPSVPRDAVIARLRALGIGSNYGAQCIPALRFYREKYQFGDNEFPCAYAAYSHGLALPLYETLTIQDVDFVAASVVAIVGGFV